LVVETHIDLQTGNVTFTFDLGSTTIADVLQYNVDTIISDARAIEGIDAPRSKDPTPIGRITRPIGGMRPR